MHQPNAAPRRSLRRAPLLLVALLVGMLALAGGPAFAANDYGPLGGSAGVTADTVGTPVTVATAAPAAPRVNVAIQAGHWQESQMPPELARLRGSTGTSGGGRTEVAFNLDMAGRVAAILRAQGLTVQILPATVPTGFEADVFVAIHADGNSSSAARGYKVSTRWSSAVAGLDAALVQALDSAYGDMTGLPRDPSITRAMRGYYAYSTYRGQAYRLSGTTPAAIIETGFMTSPADRAVLFNKPNLVASGIAAGIQRFLGGLPHARQIQAQAEAQAAASATHRAAVSLYDGVNIRSSAASSGARVAQATFGQSFPVLDPTANRPSGGQFNPAMGTALASGSGWYHVAVPATGAAGYISRDVVVVQQTQGGR